MAIQKQNLQLCNVKHKYRNKAFRGKPMHNKSPCLTRTRAGTGGYFLFSRMRMMSTAEMERIQGFPNKRLNCVSVGSRWLLRYVSHSAVVCSPAYLLLIGRLKLASGVSRRQYHMMLGNAFSVNVVVRLLTRMLPAVGLTGPLRDPYLRNPYNGHPVGDPFRNFRAGRHVDA